MLCLASEENMDKAHGVDVNDVIVCTGCAHSRKVTHQWLDALSNTAGSPRLLRIDKTMLARLKCVQCSGRQFVVHQCKPPAIEMMQRDRSFACSICSGDDGANGRCWKCGGTGFNTEE